MSFLIRPTTGPVPQGRSWQQHPLLAQPQLHYPRRRSCTFKEAQLCSNPWLRPACHPYRCRPPNGIYATIRPSLCVSLLGYSPLLECLLLHWRIQAHHHRGRCFHHYFTKPQTAFTIVTDCADPLPTFAILSGSGTPKDTGFAQVAYPAVGSTTVGFFGTSLSEGSIFSLNAAGKLLAGAEVADVKPGNSLRSSISMPLW